MPCCVCDLMMVMMKTCFSVFAVLPTLYAAVIIIREEHTKVFLTAVTPYLLLRLVLRDVKLENPPSLPLNYIFNQRFVFGNIFNISETYHYVTFTYVESRLYLCEYM